MEKLTLDIEGMHCGSCATGIQMLSSQMDGIGSSFVDYDTKKGTFEIDPEKVTKEKLIEEIAVLGYTATVATPQT